MKAAMDGFGELGYSGTDVKMTFAALPPEIRTMILSNAAEWKALTMSKDAFPELSFASVKNIRAPVLLLGGERSLALYHLIDDYFRSYSLLMRESSCLMRRTRCGTSPQTSVES